MKLQDLPFELVRDHLLCFLDEDYLFPMRLASKVFSDWIWTCLVEKKSTYSIHISVDNNRITNVVENYLIKLKNLKRIDLFSFNDIDLLMLSDVGLNELGRLSTIEELILEDALNCSGSFMANWILNSSQLLHSMRVMKLRNVKCEYFHLFKEFNNLKTLELTTNEKISDVEMDETIIELPINLEILSISYPLTKKNVHDIVRTSPTLKELSLKATNLHDEDISFVSSSYSQTIQKFMIFNGSLELEGTYLSTFSDYSFPNLKSLRIYWPLTNNPKAKVLQRNLFIPSLEKLRIFFNAPEEKIAIDPLLAFIIRHTNLSSLHLDMQGYPDLEIKQERLIEHLSNLNLKSLSIEGAFDLDSFEQIMENLVSNTSLEKLKWYDNDLAEEDQFLFLKDSMKNLRVLKLAGSFTAETVTSNIQKIANCNLEKVYGSAICASCIEYLPPSLKELTVVVDNSTDYCLKYLKNLVNLKSLKIELTDTLEDFDGFILPKSIEKIEFMCGEAICLTGLESGLLEALLATENIRQLSFQYCSVKDDFIKGLLPVFKDTLEIFKILRNEGKALTEESTSYLSQFTRCRILLLYAYDTSILSSRFSNFEHDNHKITIIFKDPYSENRKFYPKLNYDNIEQVISYVKERISAREMKEASLAIERLFHYAGKKLLDCSQCSDILKLFLVTWPHGAEDWRYEDVDLAFLILAKLWKSKSISFDSSKELRKVLKSIESQQNLCVVANILLDLDEFLFFTDYDSLLETVCEQEYEECIKDLTKRILDQFLQGKRDVPNFSGNLFVNIIDNFADDCPEFSYMSQFIDFLIQQTPYNLSKKTLANILKKKAVFTNDEPVPDIDTISKAIDLKQMSTEELLEYARNNTYQKDHSLHLVSVKVPKTGPFNTTYFSEPFIEFGYEWVVEFLPVDEDEDYGNCSIFLTLHSTINHNDQNSQFDRIRIEFSIRNFDMEASVYLTYARKFDMIYSSYGLFVEKEYVEPFSTSDENFLIFKFFVGMKQIPDVPIPSTPLMAVQSFLKETDELSSTNFPPLIHRMAAEYPIFLTTLVFRVKPENVGKNCYGDRFEAFGIQFSPRFLALDNPLKTKPLKEKSRVGLALCSFDYKDRPNDIDSVTLKVVFANSEFNTESMDITKKTLVSMEPFSFQVDRDQYKPKIIDLDGEIFYEYTVNCCIALISVANNYPHLHDDDFPEIDSDESDNDDDNNDDDDWETDEEDK